MSTEIQDKYLTKDVFINGQTIALYSSNGLTWLSTPDEVEQVMSRLENTRVTLAEGKVGDSMTALKPTSPRFRPKLKKFPNAPQRATESNDKLDILVAEAKTLPVSIPEQEAPRKAVAPSKAKIKVETKAPVKAAAKPAPKKEVKAKPVAKKAVSKKVQPKKSAPKKKKK